MTATSELPPPPATRIRVFIDFWNLQLTARDFEPGFRFDWTILPRWLADRAAELVGAPLHSYEGAHVYASHNPSSRAEEGLRRWLRTWLDREPGVQVVIKERTRKGYPTCPHCHERVAYCPQPECGLELSRTEEKGIDTAIVTDMIRLAWEGAYDVAVLVSSDRDFIPAVQFLDGRGLKVLQAGFPNTGNALAAACWGSFGIWPHRDEFRLTDQRPR